MSTLKDIRSRIASVKNTQQITRAMKMVSAAKLRRAQDNIVNLRPYARGLMNVIANISASQRVSHPLLERRENPKKILLVVVTSDRGLCGAFNGSVNRFAENYYRQNKSQFETLDFLFIGRKTADYFRARGVTPTETILNLAKDISYSMAAGVAEKLINSFTTGSYDEIRMVYNTFKSAIAQELTVETLLPVDLSSLQPVAADHGKFSKDLIFEPEPEAIIEQLLKRHFAVQVYRCMSESVAAEHAARMTAMDSATNNAKDMISSLTLTYNKLRQASITRELIEICSGAEALKG